jgi:hypothetical protein
MKYRLDESLSITNFRNRLRGTSDKIVDLSGCTISESGNIVIGNKGKAMTEQFTDLDTMIKRVQGMDRSGAINGEVEIGGIAYNVHAAIHFWKNIFTRSKGHTITVDLWHKEKY